RPRPPMWGALGAARRYSAGRVLGAAAGAEEAGAAACLHAVRTAGLTSGASEPACRAGLTSACPAGRLWPPEPRPVMGHISPPKWTTRYSSLNITLDFLTRQRTRLSFAASFKEQCQKRVRL